MTKPEDTIIVTKKKWIFANKHLCSLRSQKWDILNDFQTLSIQEIFFKELGIRLKIKRIVKNAVAAVPSQYLAAAWHESKWKIFIPENPCEYYYRTRTFHFFQGNCQLRRIFSLDDDLIPSSIRWSNHRVTREKNRIDDDPDNWAGNSKLLLVFEVKVKKFSVF